MILVIVVSTFLAIAEDNVVDKDEFRYQRADLLQDHDYLLDDEKIDPTKEELEDGIEGNPEVVIGQIDEKYGIPQDAHHTWNDGLAFSVGGQIGINPLSEESVYALDVGLFGRLSGRWYWQLGYLSQTGDFGAMTENPNLASSNGFAEVNNPRADGAEMQLQSVLAGVGLRFKFFADWWKTNRTLEMLSVMASYSSLNDSARDLSYDGPGLSAQYRLHYRWRKSFSLIPKVAFHWATVARDPLDNELGTRRDRELTLFWASWGIEFAFHL